MTPILTLTVNPTIDIGLEVGSLDPSGKNRAQVRDVTVGGGGINVARAVIELGGAATAVHTAGAEVGARLVRLLDGEGFEHIAVEIDGETREAVILFESDAERSYHVVPPGPELSSSVADALIEVVVDQADRHDFIVASGSLPAGMPEDFYARLAGVATDADALLVLDTSGPALRAALEKGVHVVKLNRREAAEIAGGEVHDFDGARRVNAEVLANHWATVAATTVGERGAMVSCEGEHHEIHTPSLPHPPRSDAGAGDSFLAALTLGLARDDTATDAGASAVAAAAAAVLTPGTELCRRQDVEQLQPGVEVVTTETAATTEDQRR